MDCGWADACGRQRTWNPAFGPTPHELGLKIHSLTLARELERLVNAMCASEEDD